jgi:hypothetical protein
LCLTWDSLASHSLHVLSHLYPTSRELNHRETLIV